MATVSRGEITITNVNDGKPSYTHWAYAMDALGKNNFSTDGGDFTKWSSRVIGNFIRDSEVTISSWDNDILQASTTVWGKRFFLGGTANLKELPQTISVEARGDKEGLFTFGPWTDISVNNKVTTEWQTFTHNPQKSGALSFYLNTNDVNFEFRNATAVVNYKFAGTYVDDQPTASTDPADYTWQRILGPSGEDGKDGDPAPLVSLSGATQAITVSKTGTITPSSSFQVTGTAVNTTISAWTYSLNGGNFGSAIPAGVTRSGDIVTINPVTATFNQLTIRAADATVSDVFTISRIIDGGDGNNGVDAYTVFLTNESYTFAGSTSAALAGSTTTEVVVYKGINKITPTSITVGTRPTGLTSSVSGAVVTFTAATTLVTKNGTVPITIVADGKTFTKQFAYALSLQGGKGDPGENGVSVTGTQVQYVQSSGTTEPTTGWSATRPTPVPGQWLWTRSRSIFSDGTYGSWATVPTLIGREAIVISTTAPSNPSTGTLWQTPTDPNVQKWDGSKWVTWGIAIDNIVAENITIENGVFKRIEGLEIYGGLIVNSFDVWTGFYVNDTDQLWRKGTTTVANSEVAIDYQNYNKATGAIIEIGSTVSGVGGNSTAIGTPQGVIKRSADFTVNGIELIDDRASGTNTAARMKYSDLIEVATLSIAAASGWSQYAASGISHPTATRTGRMVQLSGAFKPNSDIAGSADQVTMSSRLPLWARPKEEITVVQQGSGMNRYRLVVTTDGYITMSRYGTSSYATAVKDAYLNISVAYAGADIF